jgi:hypothetical protein
MTLQLTLEMDNAAFECGNRRAEAARILSKMLADAFATSQPAKTEGKLMDVNGNTVGQWAIRNG